MVRARSVGGAKERLPWLNEIRLPATECSVSENRPNPTHSERAMDSSSGIARRTRGIVERIQALTR